MHRRVIYLFPTELEAAPFRRLCPNAEVVISGVGMAATSAAIASLYAADSGLCDARLLLAGLAGSYGDCCAKGEVVEVRSEICSELPERFRRAYHNRCCTTLRSVSSNTVHRGGESLGAEIENMEGAALFALAESLGVRVAEIRAISNRVGEPFAEWSVEEALNALAQVLAKLDKEL